MREVGTYKLKHRDSGLFYIGQTGDFNTRRRTHTSQLNTGTSAIKDMNVVFKRGDVLDWTFYPAPDKERALELEQFLIKEHSTIEGICNQIHAGYTITDERRTILSNQARAREVSQETRDKISISKRGIKMPSEAIEKSRQAKLGTTHSIETRNKMSESHLANPLTTEHREKIAASRRKPITLDGITYPSTKAAATALGVARQTIHARRQKENG